MSYGLSPYIQTHWLRVPLSVLALVRSMASLSYLGLLLGFFALHTLLPKPSFTANADFFQGYRWDAVPDPLNPGSVRLQPFWQPNARAPWQQVVNFYPAQVYLEYNCYYMKEVCHSVNQLVYEQQARYESQL